MKERVFRALTAILAVTILSLLPAAAQATSTSDGILLDVDEGAAPGDIDLTWAAWQSNFRVFRSTDAATLTDPPNQIALTPASNLTDTPGPGFVFFYRIESATAEPNPWNPTWGHTVGDPALSGEQEPPCDGCFEQLNETLPGHSLPLNLHSGEVVLRLDLPNGRIPGRGDEDWQMPLLYRSQIDFVSCVGFGWNLRYATDHLELTGGGHNRFDAVEARFDFFDAGSQSAPGYFQILTPDVATVSIRERHGLTSTYAGFAGAPTDGVLLDVEDRNGNRVELNHNAHGQLVRAVDGMGRAVHYAYQPTGLLDTIVDFRQRATRFTFNGDSQLIEVRTPTVTGTPTDDDGIAFNGPAGNDFPQGKTFRFRYDSANPDPLLRDNLLGITFPNEVATGGPERYVFTYGTDPFTPETYDRVIEMKVGGGQVNVDPVSGVSTQVPAGGSYTFVYDDLAPRVAGDLGTEIRRTTVTDPNGNVTEHYYNSFFHEVRRVELTSRNINAADPPQFVTQAAWSADSLPTSVTRPEGNQFVFQYDGGSPNRFSRGNLLQVVRIPDGPRGGDQPQLVTTYTYDPIYNLRRTVTTPRGDDPIYIPPIPDNPGNVRPVDLNLDGDDSDAADGETTRRLRYTSLRIFDYQESTTGDILSLANQEGVDLDLDGGGPGTAGDVAQALSEGGGVPVDINGDGRVDQTAGNCIEERKPIVTLPDGASPQEIIETSTFNDFGQRTSRVDGEGVLTSYYYFPEIDPDGNGVSEGLARAADPLTGGYLMAEIRDDDALLAALPSRNLGDAVHPILQQPIQNGGTARRTRPAPATLAGTRYTYDAAGNTTSTRDGRGTVTLHVVNALNQIVETVRASSVDPAGANPPEPAPLVAFGYRTRLMYDFNDNVVRMQEEDRGNTSGVGANNGSVPFVDVIQRYDLLDNLIRDSREVSDGVALVSEYRYDANGNRTLTIKPEGNAVSAVHDERDLVFQATRGATTPPPFVLTGAGDPLNYDVRGGLAATTTFTYDGNRNLVERADAEDTDLSAANNSALPGAGDRARSLYDGFDRLSSEVDAVGNQSVTQYDPDGNVVRISDFGPVGGASPVADGPDPLLRPVSSGGTIQSGNLVSVSVLAAEEQAYDELGRSYRLDDVLFVNTIPTVRPPDVQDGATDMGKGNLTPGDNGPIPGLAVPVIGRVSGVFEYDRNTQVILEIEDDQDTTIHDYDGLDRRVRTVDPEGNQVETAYDDNDNLIEERETDVSQVPGVADETFLTTRFYDSLDRLQVEVDNLGQTTLFRYDSRGNLVAMADPQGPVTGASIDRRALAVGPPAVAINDPGNVRIYFHDGLDRLVREERILTASGNGDGVNVGADIFGVKGPAPLPDLLQGGGDGLIRRVRIWDDNDLLGALVDDSGNQTTYVYDNLDRRVLETKGLCTPPSLADRCDAPTSIVRQYDRDDNVVVRIDENGSQTDATYDAINRVIAENVIRGVGLTGTTATTFEYDGLSRRVLLTDDNDPGTASDDSQVTRAYDSLSRLIEETQQIGALPVRAVDTAWRAENLPRFIVYPNNRILEPFFDGLDRMQQIGDQGVFPPVSGYAYIGRDRILDQGFGNGVFHTYLDNAGTTDVGYDGLRRPIQLRHIRPDTSLVVGFLHGYNRMNQAVSEDKLHDAANSESYAYDSGYRLDSFSRPGGGAVPPLHQSWTLDGVGNWSQVDGESRQHSSFNEIIERAAGVPVPHDSDENGNKIDDGEFLYAWDFRNRLRGVTRQSDGMPVATYTYDGMNRRVRRVVTNSGGLDGTTDYYYDESQVVEERDVADVLLRQYVYGEGVDEVLALDRNLNGDGTAIGAGDQRLFYHAGRQGSPYAVTDQAAAIAEGYLYDAYGRQTVYLPGVNGQVDFGLDDQIQVGGVSNVGNSYLFVGRRHDPESDLFNFRGRYYDTDVGRFLSRDLLGIWDDAENHGNGYGYVYNDPLNQADPCGDNGAGVAGPAGANAAAAAAGGAAGASAGATTAPPEKKSGRRRGKRKVRPAVVTVCPVVQPPSGDGPFDYLLNIFHEFMKLTAPNPPAVSSTPPKPDKKSGRRRRGKRKIRPVKLDLKELLLNDEPFNIDVLMSEKDAEKFWDSMTPDEQKKAKAKLKAGPGKITVIVGSQVTGTRG